MKILFCAYGRKQEWSRGVVSLGEVPDMKEVEKNFGCGPPTHPELAFPFTHIVLYVNFAFALYALCYTKTLEFNSSVLLHLVKSFCILSHRTRLTVGSHTANVN